MIASQALWRRLLTNSRISSTLFLHAPARNILRVFATKQLANVSHQGLRTSYAIAAFFGRSSDLGGLAAGNFSTRTSRISPSLRYHRQRAATTEHWLDGKTVRVIPIRGFGPMKQASGVR